MSLFDLMDEQQYGKEYVAKKKGFEQDLAQIEQDYIDFFQSRLPGDPKNEEPHDRLFNHYVIGLNDGNFTFNFHNDTDLPPRIKEACYSAFYRRFRQ